MSRCWYLMVKKKLYFFFLIAITVGTEGQSSLLLFHTGRQPISLCSMFLIIKKVQSNLIFNQFLELNSCF